MEKPKRFDFDSFNSMITEVLKDTIEFEGLEEPLEIPKPWDTESYSKTRFDVV